jgi:hypothetical protein
VWQRLGWSLYFLTFTSSKASDQVEGDRSALLVHWQALRARLARHLGVDRCDIHYRGVRTSEGFGVLHLVVAVDPAKVGHRWRLVDFEHLQDWWRELHGAWHVNVKRIRADSASARRVSRYVVSQYLVQQGGELVDALVRTFGSRLELRLPAIRERFRELMRLHGGALRFRWMKAAMDVDAGLPWESTWREFGRLWWRMRREAWGDLLARGQCEVFGARLVLLPWCGGTVEEV